MSVWHDLWSVCGVWSASEILFMIQFQGESEDSTLVIFLRHWMRGGLKAAKSHGSTSYHSTRVYFTDNQYLQAKYQSAFTVVKAAIVLLLSNSKHCRLKPNSSAASVHIC